MHCAIYTAMQYNIGGTVACKLICEYPWDQPWTKKHLQQEVFFMCQYALKKHRFAAKTHLYVPRRWCHRMVHPRGACRSWWINSLMLYPAVRLGETFNSNVCLGAKSVPCLWWMGGKACGLHIGHYETIGGSYLGFAGYAPLSSAVP